MNMLDGFGKKLIMVGNMEKKMANQAYAEYAVRDYNKPMGIATYKTFADMPIEMQHILPDVDALKKILEESIEQS